MKRSLSILGALLFASPALADGVAGQGRMSISGGWRLTPNGYFFDHAAAGGHPYESDSGGGPQGVASFGYGATPNLEVNIELLAGTESLKLKDLAEIHSTTYGGLVNARWWFLPDATFRPWVQAGTGPLLVYTSGAGASDPNEQLEHGFEVGAGLSVRLGGDWSVVGEYRLLLVRGNVSNVPNAHGINGGGSWFGIGFGYNFGTSPDPASGLR